MRLVWVGWNKKLDAQIQGIDPTQASRVLKVEMRSTCRFRSVVETRPAKVMPHLKFFSSHFLEVEQRLCQVFHRLILCRNSVLPDQLRVHWTIEFVSAEHVQTMICMLQSIAFETFWGKASTNKLWKRKTHRSSNAIFPRLARERSKRRDTTKSALVETRLGSLPRQNCN